MVEWTTSARAELERYCALVRPQLETDGADAAEVEDDLRRHIDEEALAGRLRAVTEDDVRRILARVGTPNLPREPNATPSREADSARQQASSPSPKPLGLGVLFFDGDLAASGNLPDPPGVHHSRCHQHPPDLFDSSRMDNHCCQY